MKIESWQDYGSWMGLEEYEGVDRGVDVRYVAWETGGV